MMKYILKMSLAVAAITFIYCTLSGIALSLSLLRALTVFVGAYSIIIAFLVGLRIVLNPALKKEMESE